MSAELVELNAVAGQLSPEQVRKLILYAQMLSKPYWELPGYSDAWTDDDYRDFTTASMLHYEQQYPEDEGYGDAAQPG